MHLGRAEMVLGNPPQILHATLPATTGSFFMPVHTEFIRRFLARWETRQLVAYTSPPISRMSGKLKKSLVISI